MAELQFSRWEIPPGTSFAAVLPGTVHRCGIYVLEFADGELYVGQTVSLLSRFSAHARRWAGEIVAVRFASLEPSQLDRAERDVIARLVDGGSRLRNVDLVTLPLRSAALDLVVDSQMQAEWLAGETSDLNIGDRGRIAIQRERTSANYKKLAGHSQFEAAVSACSAYLRACIPWPHVTEGRFWSLSSLPSTGRSKESRRLCVISANNVELLVLGEERDLESDAWLPVGFMNLALRESLEGDQWFSVERGSYRSVGDVSRVFFGDLEHVRELLSFPEIAAAARELAMGLLRKGPGMFARFHDYNLSDDVFASPRGLI